jgi:hypothetical protein
VSNRQLAAMLWLGLRNGAHKRSVQTSDPLRLQAVLAPLVERSAESGSLFGVELDGLARSDRFEPFADRLRALGEGELLEEDVALVPGDLGDLSCDVDVHAIEALGHRREAIA